MTAAYLIDTNVLSELRKRSPDSCVQRWFQDHAGADVYLSVLVLGEIRYGVERLRGKDPQQAVVLEQWLAGIHTSYSSRILPLTSEIADEWGRMCVPLRPPVVDGLLAATAKVHRLTLVTRNVADFAGTGVALADPFTYHG